MTEQLFTVSAAPRSGDGASLLFMIEASSHRQAWVTAREACKTGAGAKIRDGDDVVPWPIPAARYTVTRVLSSTPRRRGRPPRLTTDDLFTLADERHVKIPRRVQQVVDQLQNAA